MPETPAAFVEWIKSLDEPGNPDRDSCSLNGIINRALLTQQPEARIVFDGPPGPESGRFIEVENEEGASIRFGTWHERQDGSGWWELRIPGGDR